MTNDKSGDPMEFLKGMWSNMGFTLPGIVTPTLDTDELGKRIADLKAVEGWLKSNLSLLQMTIQGLEMQRTTLTTLQHLSQAAQSGEGAGDTPNPFLNPAGWPMPWNLMGNPPAPTTEESAPAPAPAPAAAAPKKPASKQEAKPKG